MTQDRRPKITPSRLKRPAIKQDEGQKKALPEAVTAGAIDKVIDLAFNPSREKLREVTIIDRMQGRLFPLLDVINAGHQYILEVAAYRENASAYKVAFGKDRPVSPNLLDELLYRTAQWQKSVGAKNLDKLAEIALTEIEAKVAEEEGKFFSGDAWEPDDK